MNYRLYNTNTNHTPDFVGGKHRSAPRRSKLLHVQLYTLLSEQHAPVVVSLHMMKTCVDPKLSPLAPPSSSLFPSLTTATSMTYSHIGFCPQTSRWQPLMTEQGVGAAEEESPTGVKRSPGRLGESGSSSRPVRQSEDRGYRPPPPHHRLTLVHTEDVNTIMKSHACMNSNTITPFLLFPLTVTWVDAIKSNKTLQP